VHRLFVVGLVGVMLVACSRTTPGPSLVGTWAGSDSEGQRIVLTFADGGRGTWVVEMPELMDTVRFEYAVDFMPAPPRLDLTHFDHGLLAGATMYGIFEFTGPDAFRLDLEPGPPGAGDCAPRPTEFTDETVVLSRVPE